MLQRAEFFPFSLSGVVLFQRPGSFAIIPYFFLPAGSDFPFFDMETRDWRDLLQKIYFFSEIGVCQAEAVPSFPFFFGARFFGRSSFLRYRNTERMRNAAEKKLICRFRSFPGGLSFRGFLRTRFLLHGAIRIGGKIKQPVFADFGHLVTAYKQCGHIQVGRSTVRIVASGQQTVIHARDGLLSD